MRPTYHIISIFSYITMPKLLMLHSIAGLWLWLITGKQAQIGRLAMLVEQLALVVAQEHQYGAVRHHGLLALRLALQNAAIDQALHCRYADFQQIDDEEVVRCLAQADQVYRERSTLRGGRAPVRSHHHQET